MIDFNKYAKAIHEVAREKGWYDPPATDPERIMMLHEEATEAGKAWRNGGADPAHWEIVDGKPEGIPVELVDLWMRIADWFAYQTKGVIFNNEEMKEDIKKKIERLKKQYNTVPSFVARCHSQIARVYNDIFENLCTGTILIDCMNEIFAFFVVNDIPFKKVLDAKIGYNKKRPTRWEGRRC